MNRIAGIFNFDHSPVDPEALDRMIRAMEFQGQDGQDTWIEGGIGLGCARIGMPAGAYEAPSPNSCTNKAWVITFDGRIDNRQELLAALKLELVATDTPVTDKDLVLAAYAKWDQECPKHLIGDFAFAIWDQTKHALLCARDHFGVKPFYYSVSGGAFVFASTPHAVLASGKILPDLEEARIADFLVNPLEGVDKNSSFYAGVFRLPPAHLLVVRAGGMTTRPYWRLSPAVHAEIETEGEYIDAFRDFFAEAVRSRVRDTSAPASMLSGGLDSSTIVGIGRRILAEDGRPSLHTFAAVSDSPETNRESVHIRAVLDGGGFQPHLVSETGLRGRMDELVRMIEGETEPFDCLMNLNRLVYLHARDQGVSALLDGIDGDILISGSGQLTQLWRRGAFRTVIDETLKAKGLTAEYKVGRSLFFGSLFSALTPVAPEWFRNLRRPFRSRRQVAVAVKESIIDRDFAMRCHLEDRLAMLDSHRPRPQSHSQMEAHRIALEHPFLTVGLERYERVAASFGIEARHPFTDVRLVEFCLSLPWQLKTHRGWTKMILRRAMEPYLPAKVIWRTDKDSLMWEFNRVILKERADYFYQITLDERESLKPYVDMQKLLGFWQDYLTRGDEKHAELIWSGIALAAWLRLQRTQRPEVFFPG